MKTSIRIALGACAFVLNVVVGVGTVIATGYYGPGAGGGGIVGCASGALSTCYGATWKKYPVENGTTWVEWPGRDGGSGEAKYAYAATKTVDVHLCTTDYYGTGYYWRYAMVASKDFTYGNGVSVTAREQVGGLGINHNLDYEYDSKLAPNSNGIMNYIPPSMGGGAEWDDVMKEYEEARKQFAGTISYPEWGELVDGQGGLMWFCAPNMNKPTFSSQSNISNEKIGGYSTTGINSGALKTVYTSTARGVKVGDTVKITFSHNIYASSVARDVQWEMKKTNLMSNANYDVAQITGSGLTTETMGTAQLTVAENGRYAANNRAGSDGSSSYLVREQYDIKFNKPSTGSGYEFCEMIGVKSDGTLKNYTRVCTRIIVTSDDCPGGNCDTPTNPQELCRLWAPSSYTMSGDRYGVTSVVSRVINERLTGQYSNWRGEIDQGTRPQTSVARDRRMTYAKPGDLVKWMNCYWPGVQRVANTERTYWHAPDSGDGNNSNDNRIESSSVFGVWENKYNIRSETDSSSAFSGASPSSGSLSTGDSFTRTSSNSYSVNALRDVGKYFQETISGGYSPVYVSLGNQQWHSWGCYWGTCCCCDPEDGCSCDCWCSTCYHTNHYTGLNARVSGPVVSGAARVEVPYNFINETGVNVSLTTYNSQDAVYAGETIRVNEPYVKVKSEKYNSLTEDAYATVVDNAQVRLVAYASSSPNGGARIIDGSAGSEVCGLINDDLGGYCNTVKRVDGQRLNEGGDLNGAEYYNNIRGETFNGVYNVYDVAAGNQMCFVMAVYPYTSGVDNNLDENGDKKWYISAPACKTVAKKPSMQVYGGGVFSAGSIKTNTSDKINILGYYGYTAQGADDRRVFGSWAEQGVIANGLVEGLASGAAAGRLYAGDVLGGSPEGSVVSFCKNRVPLSFANASSSYISGICPGNEMSGLLGVGVSTVNRQAMVDYFAAGTKTGERDGDYEKIASGTGKNIYVAEVTSDNYTIGGRTLGANETRVVKVAGNVNISENIIYNKGLNYTILNTPKMVIYASGNINIGCGVSEIDALLIAGGTVYTCSGYTATDSGTWNNAARSRKLTIRGTIVASRIDFSRTWGNTVGAGTGEPAEEINYDTSAILWGRSMADAGESDTFTTVYQHELAPRY